MNRAGVPGRHARFLLLGAGADGCNCYGMVPGGCFHLGNDRPVFGWINFEDCFWGFVTEYGSFFIVLRAEF